MSKRILITGGGGFIGSWLVEELLRWDYQIIILDRLDSTVSLSRLQAIPDWEYKLKTKSIKLVWWDLKAAINPIVAAELGKIDLVIHLAASSHVDRSIEDPVLFSMDNIIGTCNLLNWIRTLDPKPQMIHASTDEVFGTPLNLCFGFKEDDTLNPTNPYSATKAGAEMLVRGFGATYNIPITMVRMTNIIGPKQHPEKFIPKVIRLVSQDQEVLIHSDPFGSVSSTRYYLDYRDLCSAFLCLIRTDNLERLSKGKRDLGVYHISGREEISNLDLAQEIARILGKELQYKLVSFSSTRPYHDFSYHLTSTKIYSHFNWEPQLTIKDSLVQIIDWYKNHLEWLSYF